MPPKSSSSHDPTKTTTPPQSIPLRDLSRPPDSADLGDGGHRHNRGRSLLSGGQRPMSGHDYGPRYERLGDTSPSPVERTTYRRSGLPQLAIQPSASFEESQTPISPVGNPADFQAAMGFAGLLVPDISLSQAPEIRTNSYDSGEFHGVSPYEDASRDDEPSYFASESFASESDTIPLNDSNSGQPFNGAQNAQGQRNDRSFQDVGISSPYLGRSTSMRLGDDLRNAEVGLSPQVGRSRAHSYGISLSPDSRTRSRSPSTATALSRAGTIVRAMSQRVVNLSGEAELIEESARREASQDTPYQASRISGTNSQNAVGISDISSLSEEAEPENRRKADPMGAGPNYQERLPTAPVEKAMRFFTGANGQPEPSWVKEVPELPNPLKGKTLGIFSAESRIRNWLCDVLVYPLTEPLILLLIVAQTVLLAVDASKNVYKPGNERPKYWGGSRIDYALLILFILFTLEIFARIIVSGFIFNAPEYSSGNSRRGVKAVIAEKYRAVFAPQRQSSLKGSRIAPTFSTPEILRAFRTKQGEAVRTVEQAQRLQLARRAFLRHSFNRLDLLAVVAFWIAFALSNSSIENNHHLYVFRMISCLRILRLLALTHGTAVSPFLFYYQSS